MVVSQQRSPGATTWQHAGSGRGWSTLTGNATKCARAGGHPNLVGTTGSSFAIDHYQADRLTTSPGWSNWSPKNVPCDPTTATVAEVQRGWRKAVTRHMAEIIRRDGGFDDLTDDELFAEARRRLRLQADDDG